MSGQSSQPSQLTLRDQADQRREARQRYRDFVASSGRGYNVQVDLAPGQNWLIPGYIYGLVMHEIALDFANNPPHHPLDQVFPGFIHQQLIDHQRLLIPHDIIHAIIYEFLEFPADLQRSWQTVQVPHFPLLHEIPIQWRAPETNNDSNSNNQQDARLEQQRQRLIRGNNTIDAPVASHSRNEPQSPPQQDTLRNEMDDQQNPFTRRPGGRLRSLSGVQNRLRDAVASLSLRSRRQPRTSDNQDTTNTNTIDSRRSASPQRNLQTQIRQRTPPTTSPPTRRNTLSGGLVRRISTSIRRLRDRSTTPTPPSPPQPVQDRQSIDLSPSQIAQFDIHGFPVSPTPLFQDLEDTSDDGQLQPVSPSYSPIFSPGDDFLNLAQQPNIPIEAVDLSSFTNPLAAPQVGTQRGIFTNTPTRSRSTNTTPQRRSADQVGRPQTAQSQSQPRTPTFGLNPPSRPANPLNLNPNLPATPLQFPFPFPPLPPSTPATQPARVPLSRANAIHNTPPTLPRNPTIAQIQYFHSIWQPGQHLPEAIPNHVFVCPHPGCSRRITAKRDLRRHFRRDHGSTNADVEVDLRFPEPATRLGRTRWAIRGEVGFVDPLNPAQAQAQAQAQEEDHEDEDEGR